MVEERLQRSGVYWELVVKGEARLGRLVWDGTDGMCVWTELKEAWAGRERDWDQAYLAGPLGLGMGTGASRYAYP